MANDSGNVAASVVDPRDPNCIIIANPDLKCKRLTFERVNLLNSHVASCEFRVKQLILSACGPFSSIKLCQGVHSENKKP